MERSEGDATIDVGIEAKLDVGPFDVEDLLRLACVAMAPFGGVEEEQS